MVFFLDENLHGNIVPGILERTGIQVEQHKQHFGQGVADEIWIPEIARRGWVIVTCDENTRFTKTQVQAIIRSKASVIHMVNGKNATHPVLATNFVNSVKKIHSFTEEHEAPFIGVLMRPSKQDDFYRGKAGTIRLIDLEAALKRSK